MSRWLLLEPYYDGSHQHLMDGLRARLDVGTVLWTLPARKWKWRMRGAALEFASRFARENPEIDGILCTSMCNVAEFRGLLPASARSKPIVLYFHENQLAYPQRVDDPRDHHFAWTHLVSAASADAVLWNSEFNRDSFATGMAAVIRRMPDTRPHAALDQMLARSRIFPVPLDVADLGSRRGPRQGVAHVVWNHRWEFDKGPQLLLACVEALADSGLDHALSILGQRFQEVPPEFGRLRVVARDRLRHWGRLEPREAYLECLASADVALSTAAHEFQGLAILEAAACGAVPLVPDALAYREIWPEAYRAAREGLPAALVERVRSVTTWRTEDPRSACARFDWSVQIPRWSRLLRELS